MAENGMRGLIDVLLLAIALGVIVHTQYCLRNEGHTADKQEEEVRLMFNSMLTVGTLMWPVVWDATIGLDELLLHPRLLLGFLWLPVILMVQQSFVTKFAGEVGKEGRAMAMFQQKTLMEDSSMLISTAFAMGSLLFTAKSSINATRTIMVGLVLVLACVLPTLHVPPGTRSAVLWRSGQFIVLNYAIAFVIAGISTDLLKDWVKFSPGDVPGEDEKPTLTTSQVRNFGGGGEGRDFDTTATVTTVTTTTPPSSLVFEKLPRLVDMMGEKQ